MIKFLLGTCFLVFLLQVNAQSRKELDLEFDNKTLPEFCDSFPTDKCPAQHNFVEFYESLFAPMRKDKIRFFEIGILNGYSHLMWRTYFRNAYIFGIDIKDYSRQSVGSGVFTYVADQSNREDLAGFIKEYGGDFDVILDDGGHAMDHQQVSLGYLFQYVKPGGYFIIEDVHTSLPKYYPTEDFKVNETGSNTTLFMLEWFIRNREIQSEYMTEAERFYLQENIDYVQVIFRDNAKHSILCVIRKKK